MVTRLIGANIERLHRDESFIDESEPGDFLVSSSNLSDPRLEKVRESGRFALYRRMHKREGRR